MQFAIDYLLLLETGKRGRKGSEGGTPTQRTFSVSLWTCVTSVTWADVFWTVFFV